jgi:hypothetical protein
MVEVQPLDEQPAGRPDTRAPVQPARNEQGQYRAGHPDTVAAARRAGQARKGQTALATKLGVATADAVWSAAKRRAAGFIAAQVRQLSATVGGGQCDQDARACVKIAAYALAATDIAYDAGDYALASKLGQEARQCLLAARELCVKATLARPAPTPDWMRVTSTADESGWPAPDADATEPADAAQGLLVRRAGDR